MDRLTPEKFEKLFNAFNTAFTNDILSSSNKFDKLKSINKKSREEIAKRRANAKFKGTSFTPNLDKFMPTKYNSWYHLGSEDDTTDIMDTINYAHLLANPSNSELNEDELRQFSNFISSVFYDTNQRFNKDDLYKIYNHMYDAQPVTGGDFRGGSRNLANYPDYWKYSQTLNSIGAQPSKKDYLNRYILNKQELENEIKQIENPKEILRTTPDSVSEPPAEIPKTTKDNEVTDTTPKVEAKPIEPKKDFYSMIKDEYNQDEKVRSRYHKLGWWK